jgi:hypothetical protein
MQIVKVATEREVRFYERVASITPQLLDFVPKYYGILSFRDVCVDLFLFFCHLKKMLENNDFFFFFFFFPQ